jgi:Cys-tRNA(Pro)/Cys-tRNA(Cys) deacylase
MGIVDRTGSLNKAQSEPNADGTWTYVLANSDPGVHNWVDPCGLDTGILTLRMAEFPDQRPLEGLAASGQVVQLADLESVLPPGTREVTAASEEPTPTPRAVRSPSPVVSTDVTSERPWKKTRTPPAYVYRTHVYEHDPKHESYGLEATERLELDPATVFKTLVADVDGRLTVAIVPVERQLDLKALAKAARGKKAQMADVKHAERTTGYVAGGISPLGQKKALPTVLDASALEHAAIHVSGGRRGLEIELAPADLQRLTNATIAAIGR